MACSSFGQSVQKLAVEPTSVIGGDKATATISLDKVAPSAGLTVAITTDTATVQAPKTVLVAAGKATGQFTVLTSAVSMAATAKITATGGGKAQTASLAIVPIQVKSVTLPKASLIGSQTTAGVVTLTKVAPAEGAVVTLKSNIGAATVTATVKVVSGQTSANFDVVTIPVASDAKGFITGSLGGTTVSAPLTVLAPVATLSLPTSTIGAGSTTNGVVSLSGPAPANGLPIALSSNNSGVTVPATVTIPAKLKGATFSIGSGATASGNARISAVLNSKTVSQVLLVNPVLAPGAWAKFMGNAASTGRSTAKGAVGVTKWVHATLSSIRKPGAFAADGTLYVVGDSGRLSALSSAGDIKWSLPLYSRLTENGGYADTPVVGPDGTIFARGFLGDIVAVSPSGTKKWVFETGDFGYTRTFTSLAVDKEGTIYAGSYFSYLGASDHAMYAIGANGKEKWNFALRSPTYRPVVALTGSIYQPCYDGSVYLISKEGKQIWKAQAKGKIASESVLAPNGNLYVLAESRYLQSITPDGKIAWTFDAGTGTLADSFVVSKDGIAYVSDTSKKNTIALNSNGSQKWKVATGCYSGPSLGPDGTVYFTAGNSSEKMIACASTGVIKWQLEFSTKLNQPFVGPDGSLYFGRVAGNSSDVDYLDSLDSAGKPRWKKDIGDIKTSSAVIASNSVSYYVRNRTLYAVKADGSTIWTWSNDKLLFVTPVIASDGTVYVADNGGTLTALNSLGKPKWQHDLLDTPSAIALGKNGTIYVPCGSQGAAELTALSSDGKELWTFYNTDDYGYPTGSFTSNVSIGADGTLYVLNQGNVLAISPSGALKWKSDISAGPSGYDESSVAIGSDGTIYAVSYRGFVVAFNPNGTIKWSADFRVDISTSVAIGADGSLYFGSSNGTLYALSSSGNQKWKYLLPGKDPSITSTPVVCGDGTIVFGGKDGFLYGLQPSGVKKWSVELAGAIYGSPAIGPDGTIYIGCADYGFYAIK